MPKSIEDINMQLFETGDAALIRKDYQTLDEICEALHNNTLNREAYDEIETKRNKMKQHIEEQMQPIQQEADEMVDQQRARYHIQFWMNQYRVPFVKELYQTIKTVHKRHGLMFSRQDTESQASATPPAAAVTPQAAAAGAADQQGQSQG